MTRILVFIILLIVGMIPEISVKAIADTFTRDDLEINPAPGNFTICHGGTCEAIANVGLNKQQWQSVVELFNNQQSALEERKSIQLAIARLESMVGKLTNTYNDKAENKTDQELNHYMDCIDESTNTSFYMMMMEGEGLLRFHSVQDRETRGFFINGWPHTTAVIKEKQSGNLYAVDSWFLNNGEQPYVIPLHEWSEGWRPGKQ